MAANRLRMLLRALGVAALFGMIACSRSEPVDDDRLVTLLGEDIARSEYDPESVDLPQEAKRMQGRLSQAEWEVWQDCAKWRPLRERIHRELMDWFVNEHELTPTREEIVSYIDYVAIQPMLLYDQGMEAEIELTPTEDSAAWPQAISELSSWKIENTLYDLYGGRVALDRGGHWVAAIDAYERFLRACEEEGLLRFHDERFRETFWDCVTLDEIQYPREYVVLDDESEALKKLREYPGTRRLRIMINRLAKMLDERWREVFDQMEHPAGW